MLERTRAVLEEGIARREHVGAQAAVVTPDGVCHELAVGMANGENTMTTETLVPWLCAGKPIAAVALGQMGRLGSVAFDSPLVDVIPEFGSGGKEGITLNHLLTHTAGIEEPGMALLALPHASALEVVCDAPLEWKPGTRASYVPWASWLLIGEVISRISGSSFSEYVSANIFEPLGMSSTFFGMPAEAYDARRHLIAQLYSTMGCDVPGVLPMPLGGIGSKAFAAKPLTGAGGLGPCRDLVAFYSALLPGHAPRVLVDADVTRLTTPMRAGMHCPTYGTTTWGLGFITSASFFASVCHPGTFGHDGYQCTVAYADPTADVAVAVFFNGLLGTRTRGRAESTMAAIYRDLKLPAYDPVVQTDKGA